jgi:hypothetical protein
MKPSQPDDAGSPSPGGPQPSPKPVPPAVVYALDCLEHATPAQVRRHMVALGYSAEEAAEAVRQAQAQHEGERPSAWGPEDAVAHKCMSVGFVLFMCGIMAGCMSFYLAPHLPAGVSTVALNVVTWVCLLLGIVIFAIGIAQMRIHRQ